MKRPGITEMAKPSEISTQNLAGRPSASVAEKATIAPERLPWISRLREARTSIDPKATVSYIVARAGKELPTVDLAPEISVRLRDDFAPGTVLQDRYRLGKELGRGGMGVVYLGRDQRLDRSVAIKVILSGEDSASGSATMDTRLKTSFADEARMGASLTHPAIATVFDFGFHHENPFTVFEYIEGETLRELIERRGRLPLDEVRLIVGPLAQALDFAHARRIVHRDLKPENIRSTEQRQFKILDLGLAREFSRQEDWRFAGTPAYAAPEQAAERPSDGRTDQYALALIVFELLTGRRPFESDSWLDMLEHHYSSPPPRPQSLVPDLPQTVDDAILKGLEKDPNRRFSTCTELGVALGCQFLTGPAVLPEILLETEIKKMGGRWKTVIYPLSLRFPRTHLALAPDALWAIHRTELMRWPLASLHDLRERGFRRLSFRIRAVTGKDRQWFRFKNRKERRRWFESLESLIPRPADAAGQELSISAAISRDPQVAALGEIPADPRVEPVVLLKGRPRARFQLLGVVEAKASNKRGAASGLAVRAAMMGADAVVDLNAEKLPGFIRTERRASGTAVRAVDEEGRLELKSRWFASQINHIRLPMLVLAIFFGGVGDYMSASTDAPAFAPHETFLASDQLGSSINTAFWIVITSLTVGMSILRWPQLMRPTAICFLAKAVQNSLSVLVGLVSAVSLGISFLREAKGPLRLGASELAVLGAFIPVKLFNSIWAFSFLLVYLYLGRRVWRIDQEFRRMSASVVKSTPIPAVRRTIGALAWILTIAAALSLLYWQIIVLSRTSSDSAATVAETIRFPAANDARSSNEQAWKLATDRDPSARDPSEALRLAKNAVAIEPDNGTYRNTLGIAEYRAGNLQSAIETLEGSLKSRGENGEDLFFLAMAHARLGHRELARELYRKADRGTREQQPSATLVRFREEAAAILAAFDNAPPEAARAAALSTGKHDVSPTVPEPKPARKAD
jgi:serine/threonine protein kinase/tetratricopeptide (TPR) repeat protein